MEFPAIDELLISAPKVNVQFVLWLIHSVLWYVVLDIVATPLIFRLINNMKSKERFMNLQRASFKTSLGVDIGDGDEAVSMVASMVACLVQHGIGGLLAVPSGFGLASLLPSGLAFAMARHGNLTELGFETKDTLLRFYEILFGGEAGRSRNPPGLIFGLLMHHTASFCMVIPINLYYPENTDMHELSCLLQLAATIAILFQQYGYTLDIKSPKDLSKMKLSISIVFAILIWSRCIRYFWLGWIIGEKLWQDENWLLFKLFCVPGVSLTLFNVAMILDATQKLLKFLPVTVEKHSEEEIVDHATDAASSGIVLRRASSYFGLNKSQKEWAKIRGVVRMGVFRAAAASHNKED